MKIGTCVNNNLKFTAESTKCNEAFTLKYTIMDVLIVVLLDEFSKI